MIKFGLQFNNAIKKVLVYQEKFFTQGKHAMVSTESVADIIYTFIHEKKIMLTASNKQLDDEYYQSLITYCNGILRCFDLMLPLLLYPIEEEEYRQYCQQSKNKFSHYYKIHHLLRFFTKFSSIIYHCFLIQSNKTNIDLQQLTQDVTQITEHSHDFFKWLQASLEID